MKTAFTLRRILATGLLAAWCVSAPAQAQTLLVEYKFNDSGTTTANSGSLGGTATMLNSSLAATDLHGAASSGVPGSNLPSDLSLNLTSAGGMGTGNTGPQVNAGTVSLSTLKSFTITGWINSSVKLSTSANSARIYDNGVTKIYLSAGGMVISLYNGASTTDYSGSVATSSLWSTANQWVFYAITYDGTSANNLKFYYGSAAASIAGADASPTVAANLNLGNGVLDIGNRATGDRPFAGSMDDFRIYGSTTDGSGALSLSSIESIRSLDVVPEPNTVAMLLSSVLVLGFLARRRSVA